jgi:hypothetical protein
MLLLLVAVVASAQAPQADPQAFLKTYCIACHNDSLRNGGLSFQSLDVTTPATHAEAWERVIQKLRTGAMPPLGAPRPAAAVYAAVASRLEAEIDRAAAARPKPGRTSAVHRLNRTEYNNAIQDLLGVDLNVTALLPGDETADGGFDNNADVLGITSSHLERYLTVARQVTRLATGLPPARPVVETFQIPLHVVQDDRQSEDLPFATRGGLAIRHHFPADGEYRIKVRLRRQYQDYIMGMGWPQRLDVRLDGKLVKRFTVGGEARGRPAPASFAGAGNSFGDPEWEKYMSTADDGLEVRTQVQGGPHVVGVAFVRELWEPEGVPQPLQRGRVIADDELYMDYASVGSVQIGGPYQMAGRALDTPSRRRIFGCQPKADAEEKPCATTILSRIARQAYRRPVTERDVQSLLAFFDAGRREGGSFDAGIQSALERLLVDPDFLLRVYREPGGLPAGEAYGLSDVELASRLSFFLWASVPDEPLLELAERRRLAEAPALEQQARRMLADPRAIRSLVNGFAAQWLNLRRVAEVVADPRFYPNYDQSLLQAFQQETELFVTSTVREDRSILDLLRADYTFVNERLARHYGIPGIYGSRFRRVTLPNTTQRGGLLAHGGLLAATSYPDRTSPVLRGKWLLDNILGMPPPPPPPGVNTNLTENKPGVRPASIRKRLEQHRKNPVCNGCHSQIDPVGFALENFDVLGGWRAADEGGNPVDATGVWPNGQEVKGFTGLRAMLLADPERFAGTLTEKLLAYALGRRLEYYDKPAVRKIVRDAAAQDYRWSALVVGIVQSPAFRMRAAKSGS